MEHVVLAYITCADAAEARRIGMALVEDRLAACCNLRSHEAIYRWQGAIETAAEYALLAKTTQEKFPALKERVLALHSYSLPCIVALPSPRVTRRSWTGSSPRSARWHDDKEHQEAQHPENRQPAHIGHPS